MMRTANFHLLLTSLVLIGGFAMTSSSLAHEKEAHASGKSGRVPLPVFTINTDKTDKCVEPKEVMLRDHMKFVLHQRDKTMHDGIRTTQHSFKNCVNCHADPKTGSVLGKDGFCESCHQYASVNLDCFECHSAKREAAVATPPPASTVRALSANQQKTDQTAKGTRP